MKELKPRINKLPQNREKMQSLLLQFGIHESTISQFIETVELFIIP